MTQPKAFMNKLMNFLWWGFLILVIISFPILLIKGKDVPYSKLIIFGTMSFILIGHLVCKNIVCNLYKEEGLFK